MGVIGPVEDYTKNAPLVCAQYILENNQSVPDLRTFYGLIATECEEYKKLLSKQSSNDNSKIEAIQKERAEIKKQIKELFDKHELKKKTLP
jgi:predicted transcriptional regulator